MVLTAHEKVLCTVPAGLTLLRLLKAHEDSLGTVKIRTSTIQIGLLLLLLLLWPYGEGLSTAFKGAGLLLLLIEHRNRRRAGLSTLLPLLLEAQQANLRSGCMYAGLIIFPMKG